LIATYLTNLKCMLDILFKELDIVKDTREAVVKRCMIKHNVANIES